ncbi:MAG TPA: peptidoglycan-binding protein [Planctomycetaceae bacterium]|nr:peptidoglycan-binding protein [Planctomycetaceae bacterium]
MFHRKTPSISPDLTAPLKVGSQGELVEDLQRTLNAKLDPSPKLGTDGEFGSVTETALKAFQKSKGLEETGVTDAKTWEALGPLVPPSDPQITADPATRQPADDVKGVPFVTAKAWGVGDIATGTIAHGDKVDERRDFASTTKLMTAYLVVKHAEAHPEVLQEVLTFSKAADETPGSTAGVRTGERITVGELLYGLMLPSGNDAATAYAEHFGTKLPATEGKDEAPSARFIAMMNATAAELKMDSTRYVNPHGLTHADHKSTVRDQFQLARAALQLPVLRALVNTRQHRSVVDGPSGYRREIVWKNTNKLLDIDGYEGVKTGTTDAAGACLISLGKRDGVEAITVVLGATSSDARYTDSRNIFRYFWQNR